MILWLLSLTATIALISQIGFRAEFDSTDVLRGDVLYVKTFFRNVSDRTLRIEHPIGDLNYLLYLQQGNKKAGFFPAFGMGRAGLEIVSIGEELSEVIMVMPWILLQQAEFEFAKENRVIWRDPNSDTANSKMELLISGKTITHVDDFVPSPTLPRLDDKAMHTIIYAELEPIKLVVKGNVLKSKPAGLIYRNNGVELTSQELLRQQLEWSIRQLGNPMRMSVVGAAHFDLLLDWELVPIENLRRFHTTIKSDSNLYRLVHVILRCNDWVNTEKPAGRDEIEKELFTYAEKRPTIEREFLTKKLKRIFESRKVEVGVFRVTGENSR